MKKLGCKCSGQDDQIERFGNIALKVETRTCGTCGTVTRIVSEHGYIIRTTVTPPKVGRRRATQHLEEPA